MAGAVGPSVTNPVPFGGGTSGSRPTYAGPGTNPEQDDLIRQVTSLLSGKVNASSLPTNLGTGAALDPGRQISRNYNYGGGTSMYDFLKKKSEGLGLRDPLGGFDAFKFMGGR